MEAAVRAFEDWEFSILESESRLEEEEEEVEEEEADEEEEDAGGDLSVQQQQAISYGQVQGLDSSYRDGSLESR